MLRHYALLFLLATGCAGNVAEFSAPNESSQDQALVAGDFQRRQAGDAPLSATALTARVSISRSVGTRIYGIHALDIDLLSGTLRFYGQSHVESGGGGPTTGAGEFQDYSGTRTVDAAAVARLRALASQVQSCVPVIPQGLQCPSMGYAEPIENYADLVISAGATKRHFSNNLCLLAQAPTLRTLCNNEDEIASLLKSIATDL